ncbi:putative type I restriction enzyme HindVIIP specificity protein [Haemophilus influenzae]|uniref:restriction endonuclease subunit S n=1 Tax=Haemophilus influenzae TaxID=727 RepID=UPI0005AEE3EB|nr:restriction endonuclease subunit S [Haemophilus influenzae]AVJ00142.1 type I restriction modification DNA specificity domain protein [Haemophilus influenzae]AVJ02142.1 type I restriction modification DNA specificity domain protein [Haemophilus influenzae]AXP54806.1 restriction endonuclease subunit S [Haemophilus influenzae]AXP76327.1 restriction endonuclease subunit S [Haemophilus influenzae]KIP36533.1 type I restriction enzyme HindVIIP specificity protein [Haemophilus influenzae]
MAFNSLATDKNWQKYSLEEICLKITSGGTPSRQNPKLYKNGNINWIKTKELNNGYIFESEEKITEEAIKKSSAKLLPVNTILLAMYGATVGELGILGKEMACNQACCALIIDPKKADYRFIFYLLRLYKKEIQSLATGAAQQNLSAKTIKEFSFYIPNLEKQKKIADILSELDKKIDLNTQINQTLEQIAQALFKSWFVDFDPVRAKVQALSDGLSLEQAELAAMQAISGKTPEELTALSQTQPDRYAELAETAKAFPCEMVEVDGVEVPKGWELSTIGDCYDVVMGQSPKGETYNENKQGMLFYQGRAEFGWRFPTPRLFTTDPKRIAEQNSILMSVRAPVGDINIALEKCCIGRGLAALQHKSKNLSFGLYQIQSIKPELDLFNGEGTVFGSINQANLKNIQIINPDEKFIQLFEKYLSSCDSKIMNNEIENNALKEIRDLLLPRLLSGEIQL